MAKGNTVKGSASKGMRVVAASNSIPSQAPPENSVPGGTPGGGMAKGGDNARGSSGNAQKSGTP